MEMTKVKDIVLECGDYWVLRVAKGFEVYRNGVCASVRVAQIGFTGDEGMSRVHREIERRELSDKIAKGARWVQS
jgi:hypothetical protein